MTTGICSLRLGIHSTTRGTTIHQAQYTGTGTITGFQLAGVVTSAAVLPPSNFGCCFSGREMVGSEIGVTGPLIVYEEVVVQENVSEHDLQFLGGKESPKVSVPSSFKKKYSGLAVNHECLARSTWSSSESRPLSMNRKGQIPGHQVRRY